MAHHRSAKKRIRQSQKARIYNRKYKRIMKMAIRSVRESKNYEEAQENLRKAMSVIDKTARRGVIHKNNAANKKSKLAHYVKKLSPSLN